MPKKFLDSKITLPALVCALAVSSGTVVYQNFFPKIKANETYSKTYNQEKFPAVSIIESLPKDLRRVFKSYATVQGWKEVTIRPASQATVRKILVKVGDPVDVQQVLLLTGSEIQRLKNDLEKIDFELRNLDFTVTLALAKKNFLSNKEFRQRELEHKASLIRAQLSKLETAESIQSPIKGVVAELGFKEGDFIDNNNSASIRIIDITKLKIQLYVPQDIVSYLSLNQEVSLKKSADSDPISASLLSISPSVDSRTGSVFVEVVIEKAPPTLVAGMFVEVELPLEKADQAISVPTQAVIYEAGKAYVYKLSPLKNRGVASKDDLRELAQVNKIPVVIGVKQGELVQISEGLEQFDQVVVQGLGPLSNGATVEVIR
jgi:RND family efflux transporter MFP subunit